MNNNKLLQPADGVLLQTSCVLLTMLQLDSYCVRLSL